MDIEKANKIEMEANFGYDKPTAEAIMQIEDESDCSSTVSSVQFEGGFEEDL